MGSILDIDPRIIRRFGNLTSVGTTEVLVAGRPYAEPAAQAARSVVSTSVQDNNSGGTGAAVVRIVYLNSAYVQNTEDVALNGTTAVNTVNTDIRFIEDIYVIKGAAAVGAVKLMTLVAGGGTEITGVGAANLSANLCHHYVPAGKTAFLMDWSATVSLDSDMKLFSQWRPDGVNLVDQVIDLYRLFGVGILTQNRVEFAGRDLSGFSIPEKTYTRVTTVPGAAGAIIRAVLEIYQP